MQNVVAAMNSSIQFNKKNFWIDPVSHNQYFVGVSYRPEDIESVETLLDIPITGPNQDQPGAAAEPGDDQQDDGADGGDALQHPADDRADDGRRGPRPRPRRRRRRRGRRPSSASETEDGTWTPYDPRRPDGKTPMKGAEIVLSGEYERMQQTFHDLGIGLVLATLLIYFLMVALFKSYITPLVILFAVPLGPDRRGADALPDRHGDQRAVAAGRDLHGRHRRLQHGAAGRLRREPADARRA